MKINTIAAVNALHRYGDDYWLSRAEPARLNLSGSMIGQVLKCERTGVYAVRGAKTKNTFSATMLKLFNTGQREEEVFIAELKHSGATILEVDEATGRQWFLSSAKTHHHLSGSCDGIAIGLPEFPKDAPVLLEFKTMGEKGFQSVVRSNVEKAYPRYYAQMQAYMGMHRQNRFPTMEWCLFAAVNKNNSLTYYEYVPFNQDFFSGLEDAALRVLRAKSLPARISDNPSWFECKMCDFNEVCHYRAIPEPNCRNCMHSFAVKNAGWKCGKFGEILSESKQRAGCDHHLYLPFMLPFQHIETAEDFSYAVYAHDNKSFKNVITANAQPDGFTSRELSVKDAEKVLTDEFIHDLKQEFPGTTLTEGGP